MGLVLHSARVVSDRRHTADGWVRFDDGVVTARGDGDGWRAATQTGDEVRDVRDTAGADAVLTPGLIDLHAHGGAGAAFDDGAEAIRTARALHRRHGTTRAVISLVTAPLDLLAGRIEAVARLAAQDGDVLGSHLEGPFLDTAHHGAHDPELLSDPDEASVRRLLDAGLHDGRQTVRQITLAPERPGGIAAIRAVADAGVVAAVGHTDADADTTRRAVDAGARLLTHAFNAMPGIHHRAPGPIAVAAADQRMTLELIADGVHVAPEVMLLLWRAAEGRVALITDAMAATGMPDGDYVLGALDVRVTDAVARVHGTDIIAGSTLTLDAAVRRVVSLGIPLSDAVAAATTVPAAVLGVGETLGTLAVGATADAVLWTPDLEVVDVWTAGRLAD